MLETAKSLTCARRLRRCSVRITPIHTQVGRINKIHIDTMYAAAAAAAATLPLHNLLYYLYLLRRAFGLIE